MRDFTDNQILTRVSQLDTFTGWRRGAYSFWVRSAADKYNEFDDKNFIYWVERDTPEFILSRPGTTNAGSYGLLHYDRYNLKGCAVLKSDYLVVDSHIKGFHHHDPHNPAYVENSANPFPYYRDPNKNQRAEEIGQIYWDNIGANDHHAGIASTFINNWSVACLVTSVLAKYEAFMDFMKGKGYPALSTAILQEANISG